MGAFLCKKTAAYCVGAWNFFFSDSKISFFGPRGVFFPTFLSFQDLLSLFKIYWVRPCQLKLEHLHQWLDQWENLMKLLSNSINLGGPLLEPVRSHQIESMHCNDREGFQNLLSYSVNPEKTPRVNFPGCFWGGKRLQTTPDKFCSFVTYINHTFCKKNGQNQPILSTVVSERIYSRLYRAATAN